MKVKYWTKNLCFPSKKIIFFWNYFFKIPTFKKINIISVEAAKVLGYYYSIVLLVGPNPKTYVWCANVFAYMKMKLGQVSNVKRMMMLLLHGKCISMGSPISSLVMNLQLLCFFCWKVESINSFFSQQCPLF
jgi:hypothetical protein